ncbi:MAG: hypothetical protein K8R69_10465, partial [Deltaproteobacteria bacterium]|nr:hypothetical protein [Deltaproteobacteria bacterium]
GIFRLTDRLEGIPRGLDTVKLGLGLFLGVYFFNLGITLYLHEYKLAAASAGWGLLLALMARRRSQKNLRDLL